MSKPSIILVPGSFALPEFYDETVNAVAQKGYDIRALHLPSVGAATGQGREGPLPTMNDDAAFIAKEVEKVADQGKQVVLFAHSYGGVPVTQSLRGLSVKDRQKQGKPGGVVALGYLTCLVPAVGQTAAAILGEVPSDQKLELSVDENGWMYQGQPSKTAALILNHIDLQEGAELVKKMPKHSSASFAGELTYPGYKDVPVSYLFCEDDLCVPPAVQKAGIEIIEKESGNKVNVTSINADHCPNITAKPELVDWIVDVTEKAKAS